MTWGRLSGALMRYLPELEKRLAEPVPARELYVWGALRSIPRPGLCRMIDVLVKEGKARRALMADWRGLEEGKMLVGPPGTWAPKRLPAKLWDWQVKVLGLLTTQSCRFVDLALALEVPPWEVEDKLQSLEAMGVLRVDRVRKRAEIKDGWKPIVAQRVLRTTGQTRRHGLARGKAAGEEHAGTGCEEGGGHGGE